MNRRKTYKFALFFCALAIYNGYAAPRAYAQITTSVVSGRAFPKMNMDVKTPVSSKEPVLLEANDLEYDQENDVITASGNVEVVQGETVLIADQLIYDQARNKLFAKGNISTLEPSGNVYFSDELELIDDMKSGVIKQFRARLSDGSLFAAARARKIDEDRLELSRAVYSPCKVTCAPEGSAKSPLWQIKTDHVLLDQAEHEAVYDDTYFELYGLPVFYTPYFSHSLPGAENESGFLTPTYRLSNNVGTMVYVPYYYSIAKDKDFTITPIFTSKEGTVTGGEYRQQFDDGSIKFDGTITRPQDRDPQGLPSAGSQFRGNINAQGQFDVGDNGGWGFDVRRTTDDTYLRRYGFAEDTLLTSKAYAQTSHFADAGSRSFARLQAISFQGLTASDNGKTIPIALPLGDVNYESAPGAYNSRFFMDGNALLLHRETGTDSKRLSAITGLKLPYISDDGQVIELGAHLRTDVYEVSDRKLPDGRNFDGTTGRAIPEVTAMWRTPFINTLMEDSSIMLEPIISVAVSPGGGNPDKIPNEDSLIPEFTDTNLFSENRYPGYDRLETGPRASYGLRGQAQIFSDKFVDWLFGQHYRLNDDRSFPYSNDLSSHFSDYVGKVGINYDALSMAYRFRLDKDSLSPKRSEVDASYSLWRITASASYLSLRNDPVLASKEVISASGSIRLSDEWAFSSGIQRDLELNFTNSTSAGLVFQNECTNLTTQIGRSYTRDRDIEPSTNFLFLISLKNLE